MLTYSVWSVFIIGCFIRYERFHAAIFIFNCLLSCLVTLRAIALQIKKFYTRHLVVSSSPATPIFRVIHELILLPHLKQLLKRSLLIVFELIHILIIRRRVLPSVFFEALLRILSVKADLRCPLFNVTAHDGVIEQPPAKVGIRLFLMRLNALSEHVLVKEAFTLRVLGNVTTDSRGEIAIDVVILGIVGG